MKVALEAFVADTANVIDWSLCELNPELRRVPRKHRIYFVLEKLEKLCVIFREQAANILRARPTNFWLQLIIEEKQFRDELEEAEEPDLSVATTAEAYKLKLAKLSDETLMEKACSVGMRYRGLKQGFLEHAGGIGYKKRLRITKRARKLVNKVGLEAAIAQFESETDKDGPFWLRPQDSSNA